MSSTHRNNPKPIRAHPGALFAHFMRRVTQLVIARSPRRLLEIGCGGGLVLRALRDAGVRCPMRGIDTSEPAIAQARVRVPEASFDVRDVDSFGVEGAGERYDVVLMLDRLAQLPDPPRMLARLSGLAERHVVLSVPWQPYFRALERLRGEQRDPQPVQRWGRRQFERLVGEHFVIQDAPLVFPWILVGAAVPH